MAHMYGRQQRSMVRCTAAQARNLVHSSRMPSKSITFVALDLAGWND
jgi:hypothetical protein